MKTVITIRHWNKKQELAIRVIMGEETTDALHYEEIAKEMALEAGEAAGYADIICVEDDFNGEDEKIIDSLTLTHRDW